MESELRGHEILEKRMQLDLQAEDERVHTSLGPA